jgi:hypothetical protein
MLPATVLNDIANLNAPLTIHFLLTRRLSCYDDFAFIKRRSFDNKDSLTSTCERGDSSRSMSPGQRVAFENEAKTANGKVVLTI